MSYYDGESFLTPDSFDPEFLEHLRSVAEGETEKPRDLKPYKISAVILCAGKGVRMGLPYNKLLYHVGNKTILEMTIEAFKRVGIFSEILCASSPEDFDVIRDICIETGASICVGGETRTESSRRALAKLKKTDIVLIHDGARPFISERVIREAVYSAIDYGSGIVAVPAIDAIQVVRDGEIVQTLPKTDLYNIQTPQAFRFKEIADAYAKVSGNYADDSEVYRKAGYKPRIVKGEYINRKITTMADLFNLSSAHRIGFGYDVHRLVEGRDLILGGIYIPYEKGLLGHSDADVLIHAVMDALLSAAGLPDIGVLFPDTADEYDGVSSIVLLEKVRKMLEDKNATIFSISAAVMAERPKLAKHIPAMINTIARTLNIPARCVNISATTTEKLGIVGDGAGIASAATALLGL